MASPVAVKKMARTSLTPLKVATPIADAPVVKPATNLKAVLEAPVAAAASSLPVTLPTEHPLIPEFLDRTAPNRGPGAHTIPTRNGMLDEVRAVCSGMNDAVTEAHRVAIAAVIQKLQEQVEEAQTEVTAGTEGAQAQLADYKKQLEAQAAARELEVAATHAANEKKFEELCDHVQSLYNVLDRQTAFLRQVFTEEALAVLLNRFVITEPKVEPAATETDLEPTVKRELVFDN